MAVLFFDDGMNADLINLVMSKHKPVNFWRVNEKITAWVMDIEGFEKNEFCLVRSLPTKKEKIKFTKLKKQFICNKS